VVKRKKDEITAGWREREKSIEQCCKNAFSYYII